MGEQTSLQICWSCGDKFVGIDKCPSCGSPQGKAVKGLENPMDVYNREVSIARDKYVKALRAMKLTKEERDAMYDEEDKGKISFKEELIDSPEIKEYFQKIQDAREKFIRDKITSILTPEDLEKFRQYEEYSDYFAGKDIVRTLHQGLGYEDARFGVMIYGEEHWMSEKSIKI
jgi:hypothetical protein